GVAELDVVDRESGEFLAAEAAAEQQAQERPVAFPLVGCPIWQSEHLRDVEELLEERGLKADHTTIWRWVQRYGPELQQRLRRHLKPTNKSWRVDETYIRVKRRWCYLYRAIDSTGATIDFLLSALRDAAAAKRL